jgi:hypothetical protein
MGPYECRDRCGAEYETEAMAWFCCIGWAVCVKEEGTDYRYEVAKAKELFLDDVCVMMRRVANCEERPSREKMGTLIEEFYRRATGRRQ